MPRAIEHPFLRPGQRFRMHPDTGVQGEFEVVRVTPGSAVVRSLAKVHHVVRDMEGGIKAEFDAPSRPTIISPQASVILIAQEEGIENIH